MNSRRVLMICVGCGKEKPIIPEHAFCSLKCWYKNGRTVNKLSKKCEVCRKVFKSFPSQNRKFCSWECCWIKKRTVKPKTCVTCASKYKPSYRLQKYCSMVCRDTFKKNARPLRICGWCKNGFMKYRYRKNKCGKVFCKSWCYGQYLKAESDKKYISKCLNCKNKFVIPVNCRKPGSNRKYCGQRCMFIYSGKTSRWGAMSAEEAMAGVSIRRWIGAHRRQHNPLSTLTSVDFYIPSKKLCVYVDGVYWHRNLGEKDRRQTKILKAAGFKVLRISDTKIRKLGVDGFHKFLEKKYGG